MVIRRIISYLTLLVLCNSFFLEAYLFLTFDIPFFPFLVVVSLLFIPLYISLNFMLNNDKGAPIKLRRAGRGAELLLTVVVCTTIQVLVFLGFGISQLFILAPGVWIGSFILCVVVLGIVYLNGIIRVCAFSGQVSLLLKVLLLILWWVPVANLVIFLLVYAPLRNEYRFGLLRHERNLARQDAKVCATRYPLLLVHGIFFRDWKLLNYWGRIPDELIANGATIYYGHQQSSSSVENSARELVAQIMQIIETTPHEKVNIIAHSKGGLDGRYAISCLGMDKYVASLTAVSTPHHGCRFARKALENVPDAIVAQVSKQYMKVFTRLGDKKPDFFGGVSELTDEACVELNERMPDKSGVLYQSVGSRMLNARSAGVPLNLAFDVVKAIDGDNDGLVAVPSMPWGETFLFVEPGGRRGVSHSDMIDQTRKDIKGFDVCELYVGIVQRLKERGL